MRPGPPAAGLATIDQPIASRLADELEQVAVIFERQLASELSAVNRLCLHVEQYRGKMLRPTLVLLSGLAAGDPPGGARALTATHRVVAAVVEMIHMATLVHDDVLDDADVRRRGRSVNRAWGNERAVMLGDYLISNAFHLCSTIGDASINLSLGEVTNRLCEGELLQLHHRDDWSLDEATYRRITARKTASLIAECCRLGAVLAGAADEIAAAMQRYGESIGVAFQIQDDLLDLLGEETVVGKSLGRDLEKGKLTLPAIYLLATADQRQRGRTLEMIARRDAIGLLESLRSSGAIERAATTSRALVRRAKCELHRVRESPARHMLDAMADDVIARRA